MSSYSYLTLSLIYYLSMENNSIIQWNLNSLFNNLAELRLLIKEYEPSIKCLQETHLNKDIFSIRGFNQYCKNIDADPQAKGGVAIFVKKAILSQHLAISSNLQAIAVRIESAQDQRFSRFDSESLVRQLPAPFLLLGDFNARSSLFENIQSSPRGKIIESFLSLNNVSVLNNNSPTYHWIWNLFHYRLDFCISISP